MFCPKCGSQIPDGVKFCPKCGATIASPQVNIGGAAQQGSVAAYVPKKVNPKLIGLVIGAVAVVAVLILVATSCFGGISERQAVDNYLQGMFMADGQASYDAAPPEGREYMLSLNDGDESKAKQQLEDNAQVMMESFNEEYGSDWTYSFELGDENQVEDLDSIRESLESYYDTDTVKVDEAKSVNVDVTFDFDNGEHETVLMTIGLIRQGNNWYAVNWSYR